MQDSHLAANRHMTAATPRIASLPADPPPVDGLEPRLIQPGDYRKGLIAGQDTAVHATKPFKAHAVLGVYRCITITASEEPDLKYNVPEAYPHCSAQWRQCVDMYAAEIAPPSQMTWGKLLVQTVFDEALQVCVCFSHTATRAILCLQQLCAGLCSLNSAVIRWHLCSNRLSAQHSFTLSSQRYISQHLRFVGFVWLTCVR